MATIDLSGYRMIARRSGPRIRIDIRPAIQGAAEVGDTLILREGETYRVTAIGTPFKVKGGAEEVTLSLEPIN